MTDRVEWLENACKDIERLDWLERKCAGLNVVVNGSRVNSTFHVASVEGRVKGCAGVRAAIDRAMEAERRKELGLKR